MKAGLEGNAEVTLKVGRCLTQYRHTQEGTHVFAMSSWKELVDLTRRQFRSPGLTGTTTKKLKIEEMLVSTPQGISGEGHS